MATIVSDVAEVVDEIARARDRAERNEYERHLQHEPEVVELLREQKTRVDEQVLDPLRRAATSSARAVPNRGGARPRRGGLGRGALALGKALHSAQVRAWPSSYGSTSTPGLSVAPGSTARFARAKRLGELVGALPVVPRAMVAADGVVMGDRASGRQNRLGGRGLHLVPLLDLERRRAGASTVVRRRAVRVDVGESAAQPPGSIAARGRTGCLGDCRARGVITRAWNSNRSHVIAVSNVSLSTPSATKLSRR